MERFGGPFLVAMLTAVGVAASAGAARADDVRLLGDWTYLYSRFHIEDRDTGDTEEIRSRRFSQLYRLDLEKGLSSTLSFKGGALVDRNDLRTDADGDVTEFEDTSVRPYVEGELRTGLYTLAGGYRRRQGRSRVSGVGTTRVYSDEYNVRGEWRPTDLPSLEAEYLRTLRHDDPRTRDTDSELWRVASRYELGNYEFLYSFLRNDERDAVSDSDTTITTHNGRVRYAGTFVDDRLSVNAGARMERSTLTFAGSSSRLIRTSSVGSGFYLLDDADPVTTVPGEFTPVTAQDPFSRVNLGRGGGISPVSVGLSFGVPVQADVVRVALLEDPNDPAVATPGQIATVAGRFSWRVFVSDDQENWTERTVTSATYDPLDNRFELQLAPGPEREFLKVVTTPLDLTPVGEIRVLDVQAYVTLTRDRGSSFTSTTQNADLGLVWKVGERTRLLYDVAYQHAESDAFDEDRTRLTNGLGVLHRFGEVFSGSTRLLVTDTWEQGAHDTTSYTYSAQLVGRYLATLSQALTYSGGRNQDAEGTSTFSTVILRTNAKMYEGWDLSFDQGYSWQSPAEGEDTSSVFLRLQNRVMPHRRMSLLGDYSVRWTWEAGASDRTQAVRLRGIWTPADSLSLAGEARFQEAEDGWTTAWEYSAGWLPLRDGDLQLNLRYSEEVNIEGDRIRSFSPNLTWAMTYYATLTLDYTLGSSEEETETNDFQTIRANFRLYYD